MNQNLHGLPSTSEDSMTRPKTSLATVVWLAALALSAGVGGCFDRQPTVERVQTNLIDKSIFEGEWWYTRTVVDIDDDALFAASNTPTFSPWPGAVSSYDLVQNSGVVGRIRWVIDQNFLYAYRSTETIVGSNLDADDADFRGSPLAVYRIIGHVDVRQEFNPVTGEATNVISESSDRQWYDRQFIRVDWSTNLVSFGLFVGSLDFAALFGDWRREPIPLGITDEGSSSMGEGFESLPAEWRPQMVTVGEDPTYRFAAEWPSGNDETVHYMSFVTQDMWTPISCFGTSCGTSIVLTSREAFLRIPPEHEYAVEQLQNSEYDRFGIIRTEGRTYLRGGLAREELGQWCNVDTDCVTGACNEAEHVCEGGLSDELGETDFLTFYRLRHNFYSDSLTDRECVADWQCNERFLTADDLDGDGLPDPYDPDGDGRDAGSTCDIAAGRCTIPLRDRPIRPVHYTLSENYPTHLLYTAFELMATWNESFMIGNRALQGTPAPDTTGADRIACQSDDPGAYCYCAGGGRGGSTRAPEVAMDGTCEFKYNFFLSPATHMANGVANPYDCWVAGRNASGADVEVTDLAMPTSYADYDPAVWGQLHFVGDECMLVLDVNSCDRDPTLRETNPFACEQLGDLRYQFMNYIDGPVDFCGVMQPVQDPLTGEAIISPINMSGNCLDTVGTQALVYWPLLRGETEGIEDGEEVRAYFENRGRVRRPAGFAPGADPGTTTGGERPTLPTDVSAYIREEMAANIERLSALRGPEGRAMLHSDRLHNLHGTPVERRLAEAMAAEGFVAPTLVEEAAAAALDAPGVMPMDVDVDDPNSISRLSPFDTTFMDSLMLDQRREAALYEMGMCMMPLRETLVYQSQFSEYWARAFEGFPNETARIRWEQSTHRAVMQHELGHGLGFEHNFAATFDRDNYQDPAYAIMAAFPLPRLDDFDLNRDNAFTDHEVQAFYDALDEARRNRISRGLGNYTSASTMDYPGDQSDQMGLGPYDRAAVLFNYFNEVEAFVGDPEVNDPSSSLDGLLRSDLHERVAFTWYRGGESCTIDSDCPHSGAAEGATVPGQLLTQRCVTNPRFSSIPEPCGTDDEHCVCSSFDEDFVDYYNNVPPYNNDVNGDRERDFTPVRYLFCSNPRLNDISWCNTFDSGESFTEAISNMRVSWEYSYPTRYFRHYRRGFAAGSRARASIVDAAKMYQHMLFRLIYEEGYDSDTTPLGLNDQFFASIDAMNWFARLAQAPDVGSYELDPVTNTYVRMGEELDMTGADIVIEPGVGYHTWSRYQEGLYGFFRMERAGVMWDKLIALRALTIRDWNLNFSIDERYFINFYDFFPREMTELFGGYVVDQPSWYAPRVTDVDAMGRPEIEYVNLYSGRCLDAGGVRPCRDPIRDEYTDPAIGGTSNEILRTFAATFALAEFPVFYDTSWERRLSVFTLDNGDGWTLPQFQADGSPTCGYRDVIPGSGHPTCADPDDADYILYTSDRLHTTYVAVKVRTELADPRMEQEQLGFELLLGLTEAADRYAFLTDGHTLTPAEELELERVRARILRDESFLQNLIELQRLYGITSWL